MPYNDYQIVGKVIHDYCLINNMTAVRYENGEVVPMANEILGVAPDVEIEHINGDTLDFRKSNLRIKASSENNGGV